MTASNEVEASEFDSADTAFEPVATAIVERPKTHIEPASNMVEHRQRIIEQYHKGADGLADRLKREGRDKPEMLVMALVDEVIKETDNLLGNQLIATEQNQLRDATIISGKRSEVLEKAIKAVQTKQMFDGNTSIDPDSPSMRIVMRFFMKKVKQVFEQMGIQDEMTDAFFRHFGDIMNQWQKELAVDLEELKSLRPDNG
jgi:hypothetical protein